MWTVDNSPSPNFLMWDGTESLSKTFQKQDMQFLPTQLHSSQVYVSKTLWNPASEQTVSVVMFTLLKISNSWRGPWPSRFQQLLSTLLRNSPSGVDWPRFYSLPLNLSFLCISCGAPKTLRHTDYFLSFNSPQCCVWVLSCGTVMLHRKQKHGEIFL